MNKLIYSSLLLISGHHLDKESLELDFSSSRVLDADFIKIYLNNSWLLLLMISTKKPRVVNHNQTNQAGFHYLFSSHYLGHLVNTVFMSPFMNRPYVSASSFDVFILILISLPKPGN